MRDNLLGPVAAHPVQMTACIEWHGCIATRAQPQNGHGANTGSGPSASIAQAALAGSAAGASVRAARWRLNSAILLSCASVSATRPP